MRHEVIFLQAALDDLEQIVVYIAQDNITAAHRLQERILEKASLLADFPMMGMLVPDEKIGKRGFRMIRHGNYLVFYKVYAETVVILRVLHGARDYGSLLVAGEDEA